MRDEGALPRTPVADMRSAPATVAVGHAAREHIRGLDGLRGFAALIVVISHFPTIGFQKLAEVQIGAYGVCLFFVLSGFLMGHLYLSKPISRNSVEVYAAARISRIVPLYYATLIVSFLIGRYIDPGFPYAMPTIDFARHIAFVGSRPVFWSIGPEFQFYLVFLLFWWLVSQRGSRMLEYWFLIGGISLLVIFSRSAWPGILVFSKLHIFIIGVALAPLRAKIMPILSGRAVLIGQVIALLVLASLFLPVKWTGSVIYPQNFADIKQNDYYQDFGKVLALAYVVLMFSFNSRLADRIFGNGLAVKLGAYSFSIYLLHTPILYVLHRLGLAERMPHIIALPLAVAIVVLVAAVSFRLLENPSRIVVRDLILRVLQGRKAVVAAPAR